MEYEVGDKVIYRPYGAIDAELRTVRVTFKARNIKGGKPGFDGVLFDDSPVWGYDDQIIRVIKEV